MTEQLTPKQERFCEEYIVDLVGKEAVIRAGYSKKGAKQQAYILLEKPHVQARIKKLIEARSRRTGITADRVLEELALIGFANMQDYLRIGEDGDPYLDFSDLTREQAAAIAEVTVEDFKDGRGENSRDVRKIKFKLADKRGALVDIGKHLGMFVERHEHTGKDGKPIQTKDVGVNELARRLAFILASGLDEQKSR